MYIYTPHFVCVCSYKYIPVFCICSQCGALHTDTSFSNGHCSILRALHMNAWSFRPFTELNRGYMRYTHMYVCIHVYKCVCVCVRLAGAFKARFYPCTCMPVTVPGVVLHAQTNKHILALVVDCKHTCTKIHYSFFCLIIMYYYFTLLFKRNKMDHFACTNINGNNLIATLCIKNMHILAQTSNGKHTHKLHHIPALPWYIIVPTQLWWFW